MDMGADVTIGVDICNRVYRPLKNINAIDIIIRAEMITSNKLSGMMTQKADVAVFPDTEDTHWSDFSRVDQLIEAGVKSAKKSIPHIRKAILNKSIVHEELTDVI
jgi:hypothetical protein